MTDEQYFDIKLLSFSALSNFDTNGAKAINRKYGGDTSAFNLGALVEEIIQGDKKSIADKFIITENTKPTASLGQLVDAMIDNDVELNIDEAVSLARMLGLWSSVKKEEVYRGKLTAQFWEYMRLQKSSKRIVSPEMYLIAEQMAKGLLTSKYTKDIFKCKEHEEIIFQKVIIWNYETCKSKLDIIKVDHKNFTVTPYDLKTTGFDKEVFINSFYKFKYYLQASMYNSAVSELMFKEYSSYELKPFQFIVVQSSDPSNPITYTVSEHIIEKGMEGFYTEEGKLLKKGYLQLIEEYTWHVKNNKFDYSKNTYECKGNIMIE